MVTEYVQVPIQIKVKRGQQHVNYDENNNEEVEKEITLKFGVCSQLPVPILWGGAEMRKYEVIDYHQHKLLSMRLSDGEEYHLPSTSWMMALTQMREDDNPKIRKLYSSYFPTASQMSNMVRGERKTYNLSAVLYPHSDNIVRVGRSNARIDEGYNAVLCLNEQEVEDIYGKSVSVIDSICNGESFVIVRNNTMNAIRLNPGVIQVSVKPSLCLPTILQPHEAKREQQKGDLVEETPVFSNTIQVEEIGPSSSHYQSPKSFMSWNVNGLAARIYHKDLEAQFYHKIETIKPDVISLQEVKLEGDHSDCSKIKEGSKDVGVWDAFMEPLYNDYDSYLTLSPNKYGGQAILIRRGIEVKKVARRFLNQTEVEAYPNGRYIWLQFADLDVHSVYVPFNGAGEERKLQRRREWDSRLAAEMRVFADQSDKAQIWLGDFNAVHKDRDMSPHPQFWAAQGRQDVPDGDCGFGGTTTNERLRLQSMLREARLMDTYHPSLGAKHAGWTFRGQGKFLGKGLKLDYIFASDTILLAGGVTESRILCCKSNREGFMGSDHAPLYCELHKRWKEKKNDLEEFYLKLYDRTKTISGMFQNTLAVKTLPKVIKNEEIKKEQKEKWEGVNKPEEFPEELWEYVHPNQREATVMRFNRFKDRKHLEECIEKIVKQLDVQHREDDMYHCDGQERILIPIKCC